MRIVRKLALAAAFLAVVSCGDSPSDPGVDPEELAGSFELVTLTFDPQGSLPEMDIRARLDTQVRPTLTLTRDRRVQVVFRDPNTQLIQTINGSFSSVREELRMDFGTSNRDYELFLMARRMTFQVSGDRNTLTFHEAAPDNGVSRDRLLQLVPEWQGEQLLDPTPGVLRIIFNRQAG